MDTNYNYKENVFESVMDYIAEDINFDDFDSIEELEEYLNDELFVCDSVTGNASGSYTFNAWKAEEYVSHNLDLLYEAIEYFNDDYSVLKKGAEACDVTIRCYLLPYAISEAMEAIKDEFNSTKGEN